MELIDVPTEKVKEEINKRKEYLAMNAPRLFRQFITYINPNYQQMWFHKVIANRCQALLEGKIKNLMVFVPPQHGKTEIVSKMFPAWAFGRNPSLKIVGCSYSATLSQQFSRAVQRIMCSDEYGSIFPASSLTLNKGAKGTKRGYLRNIDMFEVSQKGFYKTQGVCGGLTGTAVDIAIIDDPVKDALEAYSETYRERVWDWYTSVLLTRLHNESRQLFIMTRWHEDDLAGRILQREPENWEVLTIPAIRETLDDGNVKDPRKVGEALWEERHSLQRLLETQLRSPRVFSALYQQHPMTDGGNIIKSEWFKRISLSEFSRIRNGEPIVFFVDTAYTDKTSNDPSGIIATCKIGNDLYITHAQKVYKKFPDFIRFIPEYVKAQGYSSRSSIRIEPKANGMSVIDQIKEVTSLNVTKTPSPSESKETRLYAASPTVECGRVVLVDGAWNEEFIDEVCGFPAKPHDEYVDCLCYAIGYHLTNPYKPIDRDRLSRLVH